MTKRLSFLRRNSAGGKRARKRGPSSGGDSLTRRRLAGRETAAGDFPPFSLSLSLHVPLFRVVRSRTGQGRIFLAARSFLPVCASVPFSPPFLRGVLSSGALSSGGRIAFDREQAGQAVGVFRQRSRVVGRAGRGRAQPVKSAARECACPGREKQTGRANTGRPHVPDGTKNAQLFEDTTYFEKIH